MGMGESGWDEGIVVPMEPHLVAAMLRMVGAPQCMVVAPP